MRLRSLHTLVALALLTLPVGVRAQTGTQNPDWTTPLAPFRIADNLYYVGSRDLAVYLITTRRGNILINAGLESSPPQIRASVERLGFRWTDTKILLNGQAHFDHVAGAAEVLRQTHAKNFVMEHDAQLMEAGGATDFARKSDGIRSYPPAHVDRILHDGDTVSLGDPKHGGVVLTARKTAGHTRGCTTWTLRVHVPGEPAGKLRNVVIVGGFAALPGYRLVDAPGDPASYPGIASDFEHTFSTLHALPCDIFLGAHGSYFNLLAKLARMPKEGDAVWIDPAGYQRAVAEAQQAFETELHRQQAAAH
ncbi:MAG TPA: subclass B3 metallo-beta-lactamase [Acidobacteriaceae bacterium]|jgi:metallo-beta-lactamase class B|nr:subclass B3 metallo-beta-lactamase [Acidobacteriaceae bacterium]